MKILFVASGNKNGLPGAVVKNQAESLITSGDVQLDYFLIIGKGFLGYLKNVFRLKRKIKEGSYDLIHAHGVACFSATFTFFRPIVVSLLGSEILERKSFRWIYKLFSFIFWDHTIVKSYQLRLLLKKNTFKKISLIPNGVDLSVFKPLDKRICRQNAGFNETKKVILFMADPTRKSKNFALAKKALKLLKDQNIEFKVLNGLSKEAVINAINAADIVLLSSLWEGSPNIVKEAMACNCPVVATNVGDIEWLFGNEPGHFISSFEPEDVAEKISMALEFAGKHKGTNGRKRIVELGLDSVTIAKKLISIYKEVTIVGE